MKLGESLFFFTISSMNLHSLHLKSRENQTFILKISENPADSLENRVIYTEIDKECHYCRPDKS